MLALAGLVAVVTGCPHNDYTVELTPHGAVLERKLVFYRLDGTDTNGVPKYQAFPSNELVAITGLYPARGVTREGERYTANGEFTGALPGDVGGTGNYRHYASSLGTAGFYAERFRGNDDLFSQVTKRFAAADELGELALGWSQAEFGHEPQYQRLRQFLEVDFRRDLKNLALHMWSEEVSASTHTNAEGAFIVRFGQYLLERGYWRIEDAPKLVQSISDGDNGQAALLLQRFLAARLGAPAGGPMPERLAFVADSEALISSWDRFVSGTEAYRNRLEQWEKEKELKPDLQKPSPSDLTGEMVANLVAFGGGGEDDHLTVRLSLPAEPDHANGRWEPARKQVVWESGLEAKDAAGRLPVFCYASWSSPNESFQREHFGRVALRGDDLLKYCLWREGLTAAEAGQWDKWLVELRPSVELTNRVAAFEFPAAPPQKPGTAEFGKNLLNTALKARP